MPLTQFCITSYCVLFLVSFAQADVRHALDMHLGVFVRNSCLKNGERVMLADQKCCEGYALTSDLSSGDIRCHPACDPPCVNGYCAAPNFCECFSNFTQDLSGSCVPACPSACLNGICRPDGTCKCNTGYILSENKKFCIAFCSKPCPEFMNCTTPERCSCRQGYSMDWSGSCRPICEMNCLGGDCVSPNICFCYPEFSLKDGVCQADCKKRDCKNGKCILKDICVCDPGYTLNATTGQCDPVCNECRNGDCIAPGICKCVEGYSTDGKTCRPYCFNDCKNGYCTAPYQCVCKDGFAKNLSGFCVPLKCSNGLTEKSCSVYHNG